MMDLSIKVRRSTDEKAHSRMSCAFAQTREHLQSIGTRSSQSCEFSLLCDNDELLLHPLPNLCFDFLASAPTRDQQHTAKTNLSRKGSASTTALVNERYPSSNKKSYQQQLGTRWTPEPQSGSGSGISHPSEQREVDALSSIFLRVQEAQCREELREGRRRRRRRRERPAVRGGPCEAPRYTLAGHGFSIESGRARDRERPSAPVHGASARGDDTWQARFDRWSKSTAPQPRRSGLRRSHEGAPERSLSRTRPTDRPTAASQAHGIASAAGAPAGRPGAGGPYPAPRSGYIYLALSALLATFLPPVTERKISDLVLFLLPIAVRAISSP
ncbi:hypothetical protein Mp_8g16200 [Marchantia polymorpha subsp. ruderalis]|uniref:Uncharacterized protein n=1 Tax=Marchantia polymorpha TaxID=3197 RepID=A0A2R6W4U9_MARPO|nr:hypothetical protein MARPO_0154s0044 [Marchantia polymorpha]BBN20071.1 hypothetical protein Mp_8g16200 [Marchantia polymorpha subsp. ruderalis]|eukprot:PTQ28822.1 hypothetical protein MARPO_0154s0044 [Marchantia polymorpha]